MSLEPTRASHRLRAPARPTTSRPPSGTRPPSRRRLVRKRRHPAHGHRTPSPRLSDEDSPRGLRARLRLPAAGPPSRAALVPTCDRRSPEGSAPCRALLLAQLLVPSGVWSGASSLKAGQKGGGTRYHEPHKGRQGLCPHPRAKPSPAPETGSPVAPGTAPGTLTLRSRLHGLSPGAGVQTPISNGATARSSLRRGVRLPGPQMREHASRSRAYYTSAV